jgi:hypothetical protein
VKGYIAQEKKKKVKWAKVIASTKCKKSCRDETQLVKGGGLMAFFNKSEVGDFFGQIECYVLICHATAALCHSM